MFAKAQAQTMTPTERLQIQQLEQAREHNRKLQGLLDAARAATTAPLVRVSF